MPKLRNLRFEPLESRRLLTNYLVNSAAGSPNDGDTSDGRCDTGNADVGFTDICTLRAAVSQANGSPGKDTIRFSIPGAGVPRINLPGALFVTGQVDIDATSQAAGTVELRDASAGPSSAFQLIVGSSGSVIRGFTINGFAGGVAMTTNNNRVVGNRFGVDPAGNSAPITNSAILVAGQDNIIGGDLAADRNVISNSLNGITIISPGAKNTIQGNYIGTDDTGFVAEPNPGSGITINFASSNIIEDNVIAASGTGIAILGSTAVGNTIRNNKIGSDVTGTITDPDGKPGSGDELGNGKGIFVNDAPNTAIAGNVIVGSTGIGADFGYGIHFANANAMGAQVTGNMIGVDVSGTKRRGNSSDGILIQGTSRITVGGTKSTDRNVVSANGGDGITIVGSESSNANDNEVLGNLIGTDITGTIDLGNTFRGVHIDQWSRGNAVGGTTAASRNIISGNDSDGVIIALPTSTQNIVYGNYIGTTLDGMTALGNSGSGVFLFNAVENLIGQSAGTRFVRNVIAANAEHGVKVEGTAAVDNVIAGNLIGSLKDGDREALNGMDGVLIIDASNNQVGGVFAQGPDHPSFPGNVIAAQRDGVRIEGVDATGNTVLSNLIGIDSTGKKAWLTAPLVGVHILDGTRNGIGVENPVGATAGGNTISNTVVGIKIEASSQAGTGSSGNFVGGNYIGTDFEGNLSDPAIELGSLDAGVLIVDASNNYIGGQPTAAPNALPSNIIAGGGGEGVRVEGNAKGNVIQGNSIFANEALGIDLGADGVTEGDKLDQDRGSNDFQNSPYVAAVNRSDGKRAVIGSLHSKARSSFRIELFVNDSLDESGFGEGQTFLGALDNIKTDEDGNARFAYEAAILPTAGFITATATDPSGNTSEFSCGTRADGIATDGYVFGVTNTKDDGSGSLRNAIEQANANAGLDLVHFCLIGSGPKTITPETPLPTITDPVVIDGLTYEETECNTNEIHEGSNASLFLELDGSRAGPAAHGFRVTAGGSTIRGFAIHSFEGAGIQLEGGGENGISCNYVGTNPAGTVAMPNLQGGIQMLNSADNSIGGEDVSLLNLISGNASYGVSMVGGGAEGNIVDSNLIGTNAAGDLSLQNEAGGVYIEDGEVNEIGGFETGNVISGNSGEGVKVANTGASGEASLNSIVGNYVGTNAAGNGPLPNTIGVLILSANSNIVEGKNLISGNSGTGVLISGAGFTSVSGNRIGTDASGQTTISNGSHGVHVDNGSNSSIGGFLGGEGNLISGNGGDGVRITASNGLASTGNLLLGNNIGTNADGSNAIGNGKDGVFIQGGVFNRIGSLADGGGNLISGNLDNGVHIKGVETRATIVEGNRIGTDASGSIGDAQAGSPMRNFDHGVLIEQSSGNRVGSVLDPANLCSPGSVDDPIPANTIAGNSENGVRIDGEQAEGNLVHCNAIHNNGEQLGIKGHGVVVSAGTKNSIRRNALYDNFGRGIDLGDDSISLNDVGDADVGANNLQDYPVVIDIEPGLLVDSSTWVINSDPNTIYLLDFFSNLRPDPSGFGEGQFPFHTESVMTNQFGNGTVTISHSSARRFISATATDPDGNTSEFSMIDTDGDALADAWETQGTDADGNGMVETWELGKFDINEDGTQDHITATFLPGADYRHKDIFVEVDMMKAAVDGPPLPQPSQADLDVIAEGREGKNDGFAKVPDSLVNNPDLADGITLHPMVSDTDIVNEQFNGSGWPQFDAIKAQKFGTSDDRNADNSDDILAAKRLAYRYGLFADRRVGNSISGVGELPEESEIEYFGGNDFIVTLGAWSTRGGTTSQQQGTFMHELGHALGLRHGGNDHKTYKPNFHSVMNYTWQTPKAGRASDWLLSFSDQKFLDLDESSLNEAAGIGATGGHAAHATAVGPPPLEIESEGGAIDWNRDFDSTDMGVDADINRLLLDMNGDNVIDAKDASPGEMLHGYEDWSKIRYYFLESLQGGSDGVHIATGDDEITFETHEKLDALSVAKDLELAVVPDADGVGPGDTLTYTVTVTNRGTAPAFDLLLTHSIPPELMFEEAISPQGSCRLESDEVLCSLGRLNAGDELLITIAATAKETGVVTATTHIMGNEPDPVPENNTAATRSTIANADLRIADFTTLGTLSTFAFGYEVVGQSIPAFEIAFYSSSSAEFDATAIEIGSRVSISDSVDLSVGQHILDFEHPSIEGAIEDRNIPYIFAVVDPEGLIVEQSESNNVQAFLGVFRRLASPTPVVVRGGEQADVVLVQTNSTNLSLVLNGSPHSIVAADVSQLIVITNGGDDLLTIDSEQPPLLVVKAGEGTDTFVFAGSNQVIDLTQFPDEDYSGIDVIDLTSGSANQLTVGASDVINSTDSKTLTIRHDEEDRVVYSGADWEIDRPEFSNGTDFHVIENGEAIVRVDNTRPWQNPLLPLDSSFDNFVSPIDVLLIINTLNDLGGRVLRHPTGPSDLADFYYDSNGDNIVSPIDVLLVVNFLNSNGNGEAAEGEFVGEMPFEYDSFGFEQLRRFWNANDLIFYDGLRRVGQDESTRREIGSKSAFINAIEDRLEFTLRTHANFTAFPTEVGLKSPSKTELADRIFSSRVGLDSLLKQDLGIEELLAAIGVP